MRLRAANEGTWGHRLVATLSFAPRPIAVLPGGDPAELVLDAGIRLVSGDLVRLRSDSGQVVLRTVQRVFTEAGSVSPASTGSRRWTPVLLAAVTIEHVEADARRSSTSTRPDAGMRRFTGLGLQPAHPRFLARCSGGGIPPDGDGRRARCHRGARSRPADGVVGARNRRWTGGEDRWHLVTPADVFGRLAVGDESGIEGVDALLHAPEVATIVVPDLYSPAELPTTEPVDLRACSPGRRSSPAWCGRRALPGAARPAAHRSASRSHRSGPVGDDHRLAAGTGVGGRTAGRRGATGCATPVAARAVRPMASSVRQLVRGRLLPLAAGAGRQYCS